MKKRRWPLIMILTMGIPSLLGILGSSALAVDKDKADWVALFDGRTLEGWEVKGGQAEYRVEEETIVGRTVPGSPNTFLCTQREYGDFILEFEVLNDPRLNSGVQFRSHTTGKGEVFGYQVEIADQEHAGTSGGVWDEARRNRWLHCTLDDPVAREAFRVGEWNHYRVEAMGDSIKTWVNGVLCSEFHDATDLTGFIGLQVHSYFGKDPVEVRWRNLMIQDFGRHAWKPLWDGQTDAGWQRVPGGQWILRDGILEGSCTADDSRHGLFMTEKRFRDFTARLKFKAIQGNSGFYFRVDPVDSPVNVHGLQAEIDEKEKVGGLYETGGRAWVVEPDTEQVEQSFRPGEWNEMMVSAHGRRITVHVNGHVTAELLNDEGRLEGHLALQLHGQQDMMVQFKDIEILEVLEYRWDLPFSGKDLSNWEVKGPAEKSKWTLGKAALSPDNPKKLVALEGEGDMINLADHHKDSLDLHSKSLYGDVHIELEVMVPQGSNSGIYVHGEYEIQVLDSFGRETMGPGDMGAIYGAAPPPVNASKAPGEWQNYIIQFKAPRFNAHAQKVANARFLLVELNGQVLHQELELKGLTPGGVAGHENVLGSLMFQGDHGPVAYRKIRLRPLGK